MKPTLLLLIFIIESKGSNVYCVAVDTYNGLALFGPNTVTFDKYFQSVAMQLIAK